MPGDDPSAAAERAAVPGRHAPFGAVLRQFRDAAALSQEELADRAGLSRRGISDLERGARRAPWPETVRMLADALALDESDRATLLAAARPVAPKGGPSAPASPTMGSLPTPLTQLIGREIDVAAVRAELRHEDARLVTIVGPGGVGKTRLAIAVADGLRDAFLDGIAFADLSALTEPRLVVPTIAIALGVRNVAHQPLRETVAGFLSTKQLLLVLDNCERVLAAGRDVTSLLAASPGLTVLATSREPFHIQGERQFALPPLQLPDPDRQSAVDEVGRLPAVRLFVERAQAVQPDFALTTGNAAAVAAICRRLDGLPLAIELAAARTKVLPTAALLARLEPRLPLLIGGGHDLPARQRTMRDTIAWSYDLLAPEERGLFRRLAVFAGGFTLPAAEVVAAPAGERSVLSGTVALVEQSLLRPMPSSDDTPRYLMLETVREFGLEQLVVAGEADDAHRRHAAYFLQLADDLVKAPPLLMNLESLARVASEQDNVRVALNWFDEYGERDAVLKLSAMLSGLWFARGLYREGVVWVERALERSTRAPSVARIRALVSVGMLAVFLGDYARAEPFLAEGLALAREVGDPLLIGEALTYSGQLSYRRGQYGRATSWIDEAYRLLSGFVDSVPEAIPVTGLALLILGATAMMQRQFDRAAVRVEEAIAHFRAAGSAWGLSDAQAGLAAIRYCTGDVPAAAALYWESLQRARAADIASLFASSLLGLAAVAVESGQADVGARLLGAAEGSAASLGAPIFTRDLPVRDRALAALALALGPEQLAALREAGRDLGLASVMAEAEAVAESVAPPPP
jgi:predicted ATPase/DNA-binding XRE family transcriptional regulator